MTPEFTEGAPPVYFTAGIHPHVASEYSDELEKKIEACMAHPSCVAWGECGLDYFRLNSSAEIQKSVFVRQLQRAVQYNKPGALTAFFLDSI